MSRVFSCIIPSITMTRIFGFESMAYTGMEKELLDREVARVFGNMQASLRKMYAYNWHVFELGMIAVTENNGVVPVSLHRGYRGFQPHEDIWNALPLDARSLLLGGDIKALFSVLGSEPDNGAESF